MKTPITDKFYHSLPVEYDLGDATDNKNAVREFAERLELDRAALMDALESAIECKMVPISSASEGGASAYSRQVIVADQIRAALSAARANFPDAD